MVETVHSMLETYLSKNIWAVELALEGDCLMKATTIKQPWVSLITLGEKKLKHVVGQHLDPIAIQAGKTMDIGYCECPSN